MSSATTKSTQTTSSYACRTNPLGRGSKYDTLRTNLDEKREGRRAALLRNVSERREDSRRGIREEWVGPTILLYAEEACFGGTIELMRWHDRLYGPNSLGDGRHGRKRRGERQPKS